MRRKFTKTLTFCVCSALVIGGASGAIHALADEETQQIEKTAENLSFTENEEEIVKDEIVYILANADGSVQKIIVSDWIKNTIGATVLNDQSMLTDIINVKGNESFRSDNDYTHIWDVEGNDLYYQGNIEKELPVNLKVSYTLDGKTVTPDELKGKSGKVTIRFDYENNQYEIKEINGKKEKIFVPFAMLTGILLDNDIFTNVEVAGGKIVNDGDRTAIIGIAFPGLSENLDIDDEKIDIPDYLEITADVRDFELGMTLSVATNDLFNKIDLENLDSVGQLGGSLDELTNAMKQLMDGSSQLYDGLNTLLEKSGELSSGINRLNSGALELKNGAGDLDAGAVKLQTGASQLYDGLNNIVSNNGSLNSGAAQVFQTLLSAAQTQITAAGINVPDMTISNYAEVLNNIISSLDEDSVYQQALQTVTAAVEQQRDYIKEQVNATVRTQVAEQVNTAVRQQVEERVKSSVRETIAEQVILQTAGMDKAAYDSAVQNGLIDENVQDAVNSAIDEKMSAEEIQQTIADNVNAQMNSEEVLATISSAIDSQMTSEDMESLIAQNIEAQVQKAISDNMMGEEVQAKLSAASEGAKSIIALKTSLDSYNSFYLGLQTYTAGVAEAARGAGDLKTGADTLKDGTNKLYAGTNELYNGISTMKNSVPALVDGITQLRDGSMQLSDGLVEFNEEGIQKLVEAVDGDLDNLLARLRATSDVSKNYYSFSEISDEMDGQVKFIYRTDAIKN